MQSDVCKWSLKIQQLDPLRRGSDFCPFSRLSAERKPVSVRLIIRSRLADFTYSDLARSSKPSHAARARELVSIRVWQKSFELPRRGGSTQDSRAATSFEMHNNGLWRAESVPAPIKPSQPGACNMNGLQCVREGGGTGHGGV